MNIPVSTAATVNPLVPAPTFAALVTPFKLTVVGYNLQGDADGVWEIQNVDDNSVIDRFVVSASGGGLVWGENNNGARQAKLNTDIKLVLISGTATIRGTIDVAVR